MPTDQLAPGLEGRTTLVVAEAHTAPHVGSGAVHVLATPVLINLMEAAALEAVERFLPPGHQTVGTRLDVEHFAATPVGMHVTATARVTSVSGRVIRFTVGARDEIEDVGRGAHERVIIDVAKFDQRMRDKIAHRTPSVKRVPPDG